MLVSEIMSRGLISVAPEDTVESAARLLSQHCVGALPVCGEDGRVRGIVTDRDIVVRAVAADTGLSAPVKSVMTRAVATVDARADVREAARLMAERQVRRLPVLNGDKVCGMISLGDVAKSHICEMEALQALGQISQPQRPY